MVNKNEGIRKFLTYYLNQCYRSKDDKKNTSNVGDNL